MKTSITRRSALFGAAIALPAVIHSGSETHAAELKGKGKGGEHEGPIHRALKELKEVKIHLEKAGHDFGGHKEQAIKDVEAAHKSLEKALAYEQKRGA